MTPLYRTRINDEGVELLRRLLDCQIFLFCPPPQIHPDFLILSSLSIIGGLNKPGFLNCWVDHLETDHAADYCQWRFELDAEPKHIQRRVISEQRPDFKTLVGASDLSITQPTTVDRIDILAKKTRIDDENLDFHSGFAMRFSQPPHLIFTYHEISFFAAEYVSASNYDRRIWDYVDIELVGERLRKQQGENKHGS